MAEHEEAPGGVPQYELGKWTVIHDVDRKQAIMQVVGTVVLPIGARVELVNPNRDAVVVGVRLLAPATWSSDRADKAVSVCLDVKVEDA